MKKFLIISSVIAAIFLASAFAIPYFVDANNYKKEIIAAIKQQTGYDVSINGDIKLKIFPDIALNVVDIEIVSPNEKKTKLLSMQQMLLNVKVIPLLKKHIEVDSFIFIKPEINLSISAKGENNWSLPHLHVHDEIPNNSLHTEIDDEILIEDLVEVDDTEEITNNDDGIAQEESAKTLLRDVFQLNELRVVEGAINYTDLASGSIINISNINFNTSLNKLENPLYLSGKFNGFDNPKLGKFVVDGTYYIANDQFNFEDFDLKFDNIDAKSNLILDVYSFKPTVKLALYFGDINLNGYKLKSTTSDKTEIAPANVSVAQEYNAKHQWSDEPIDFSILNKLDSHFSFKASSIVFDNKKLGDVAINSFLRNNKLNISIKNIELLGGNITGDIGVDNSGGPVNFLNKLSINEIDLSKIPGEMGVIKSIDGKFNANLETTSAGSSLKAIFSNMKGSSSFNVSSGTIEGIDLFSMVKNATAAFNIGSFSNKTKFEEISASFTIDEGIANNNDLILKSDLLNFAGSGDINLNDLTLDYKLEPKYSQDFDADKKLPVVPVMITGAINRPVFRLDVKSIVKDLINNRQGPENLVKQLKRDFKDIKNNINNGDKGAVINELKNIFK